MFCEIVAGRRSAHVVYETGAAVAFLDQFRQPADPGHVLVIPKAHVENIYGIDDALGAELFAAHALVARAVKRVFDPDGISTWSSNERGANQEVPHFHLHVYPRRIGATFPVKIEPPESPVADDVLASSADRIRRALGRLRPLRPPPQRVLEAFGVNGPALNLTGGRGDSWGTAGAVLKPVGDEPEATWISAFASRVEQRGFRIARPMASGDGHWVIEGWCAWERVAGEHRTDLWSEMLEAAAAFHRAVSNEAKPEFLDRRADRWRIADRIAWGDLPATEFEGTEHVGRLLRARRPLSLPSQLVHGDLVGNVLFADGLPPAIIDLSLYWRPVGYSAALVVADALAWEGAQPSIIELIEHFEGWPQLLLRAAIFRIAVSELARRAEPWRNDLTEHYRPLVDQIVAFAS